VKRVSLEAIAREAHVSPTTIYNYFGTRENLLYEVIKILVQENMESSRKLIRSNISFP
jgi:AcrR family transcriptional regulator